MTAIINKKEIESFISKMDTIAAMEEAFIQYSNGNSVVPPVGELLFDNPTREVHLKYGYIKNEDFFCIKVAGGFYENAKLGISSSQGLMLLFSQQTGEIKAILLDNGYLTDIRTAAAGALSTKYFAPKQIKGIGILGTGIQGKLQLQYAQKNNPCKTVWIWNRSIKGAQSYEKELGGEFDIRIAESPSEVAYHCNLIFTTTPSKIPLLSSEDIQPGTHITAVGSDTEEKQELQSEILAKADIVVSDSIAQSKSRGEIFKAEHDRVIKSEKVLELGTAIQNKSLQRVNDDQISVVDLTGVAVQDIMIAKSVYLAYLK